MPTPSLDRSFDHIAVAVHSIEEAKAPFELLTGERCSPPEVLPGQGARVAFIGRLELVEPYGPDSTVERFLERRGSGIHHVAYATDDLAAELARLHERGVPLIDKEPRPGACGHSVAFIHPRGMGGVLVELVQSG